MESLIFRVDASPDIGTGHLMRCMALGQTWKDAGGNVIFITACQNNALLQRLRAEDFDIHLIPDSYPNTSDWIHTKNIISNYSNAWIILDGYHFDENYQIRIKELGNKLFLIDDTAHLDRYYADIMLNQNLHADELNYHCEPYTKLLLGTKYVLLRKQFMRWQGWRRKIPDIAHKVLITLGGSDPSNQTLKIIRALQKVDIRGLEVVVVVGASNPHFREIQSTTRNSRFVIRLIRNATDMPELMAWADIAVSAGGSTSWELAFMGLPALLIVLAENQRRSAKLLAERKVFLGLGEGQNVKVQDIAQALKNVLQNCEIRKKLSQKEHLLVDGMGVERIIKILSKA